MSVSLSPPQLATQGEGGATTIQTIQGMDGQTENMTVDLSEAGLGHENQLIITGEDGHGYPVSVSGMITVPMSQMYQMVANIQHLHQNGDGTVCLTPIQVATNGGGSMAPTTKYHMLRAVAAPVNTIKYEVPEEGASNGLAVAVQQGQRVVVNSTSSSSSSNHINNSSSSSSVGGGGGGMSTGLASLIDVIQSQMKNEVDMANDCNNNDRDEDGEEDSGGGGAAQVTQQRTKLEFMRDGDKRIIVQMKQK